MGHGSPEALWGDSRGQAQAQLPDKYLSVQAAAAAECRRSSTGAGGRRRQRRRRRRCPARIGGAVLMLSRAAVSWRASGELLWLHVCGIRCMPVRPARCVVAYHDVPGLHSRPASSTCRNHPHPHMQTGDGRFRCIVTQKRTPFVIGTFDTGGALALQPVHFGPPLRL